MHYGTYVFAQIMEMVPHREFQKCVDAHRGQYRIKNFSCWDQFLAMTFGQLAHRESIRDIVACLKAHDSKRYHLGFRSSIAKSTLTDANEKRDWRIYRDLAKILIEQARELYVDDTEFTLDLDGACYALDSTSIDLCLSLFRWAPYVETKGAVKVHTQMDLRGSIPTHFEITSGKVNDVNFLDTIEYELNAHYVMDRGYLDFKRLHSIHEAHAYFLTSSPHKNLPLYPLTTTERSEIGCPNGQKMVFCSYRILNGNLTNPVIKPFPFSLEQSGEHREARRLINSTNVSLMVRKNH
jgi:hypothetical protein